MPFSTHSSLAMNLGPT